MRRSRTFCFSCDQAPPDIAKLGFARNYTQVKLERDPKKLIARVILWRRVQRKVLEIRKTICAKLRDYIGLAGGPTFSDRGVR